MRYKLSLSLICFLLLCPRTAAYAQMTPDEAMSEFISAGAAYKEGRYDTAITNYENILKGGRVSGPLYYNLGNSYYKKNEIGKAMLNYERALRYMPRDSDLKFNRKYLNSRINRSVNADTDNILNQLINGFIGFYTVNEMILILFMALVLTGTIILLSLYLNWTRQAAKGVVAVCVSVFIIYSMGLMVKVEDQRDMAVLMKDTQSFFEPRQDSTIHFKLPEGGVVKIIKTETDWVKVRRADGKIGWVDKDFLERI